MKDAIGGSLLLNIVVIVVSVVILFFVGIIAYSKAYKIKNRIIEVIEKNETYDSTIASSQLDNDLKKVGYITATSQQIDDKCSLDESEILEGNSNNKNKVEYGKTGFLYCVYEKKCEKYDETNPNLCVGERTYEVVTYIHFNFPIIGDLMTFAVRGETKTLGRVYDY